MRKDDVISILRGRYPQGEYVIMPEVADATGGAANRTVDFVIMSMYPSRGLRIIGIEQKASRSDWLREIKMPQKQEPIFRHCDYFFLLTTDENIAKMEEIPETWGWLNIKGNRVYTKKEAPKQERGDSIPKYFVASLIRAGCGKLIHPSEVEAMVNERVEHNKEWMKQDMESLKKDNLTLLQSIQEFEKSSGMHLSSWRNTPKQLGEAVKLVLEKKIDAYEKEFEAHLNMAKRLYDQTKLLLATIKNVNNENLQSGIEAITANGTIHDNGIVCDSEKSGGLEQE